MRRREKLELIARLTEEAREICTKFGSLIRKVYRSLKKLDDFDVFELVLFLMEQQKFFYLPEEKRIKVQSHLSKASDLQTVLIFLQTERYISWFNYPLLGSIIKEFKVCETDYEEYIEKQLTPFLQRSLFEIPSDSFNDTDNHDPEGSGQFILKIDVPNPDIPLKAEILIHLRRHVSTTFGIAIDAFEFCSYNKGCIQFVLAAPLTLLQNIFPLPDKALKSLSMFGYKGLHIKSVEFNNTQTVCATKKVSGV